MKFVTIHGTGFNFDEPNTFGPYLTGELSEFGEVYNLHLPLGEKISYANWCNEVDKNVNLFTEDTIVIAHSLGTFFVPKYLAAKKLQINTFIAIAGGLPNDNEYGTLDKFATQFKLSKEDCEYIKYNVKNRCFIYSDNDRYFNSDMQQRYINNMNADGIYVEGKGHFGRTEKVTEIPEVIEIVKNILDK